MKRINEYSYANKTKILNGGDIGRDEQNFGKNPISTVHSEETNKKHVYTDIVVYYTFIVDLDRTKYILNHMFKR